MRHWTTEERLKQSQLIQNWKPWDKSTGAKTIEGKAISSRNAYKGGSRLLMRAVASVLKDHKEKLKML